MPEFVYAGEPEEQLLIQLERSVCFIPVPGEGVSTLGQRLQRSGFLGPSGSDESWVFDHVPKTGGTQFTVITERRLYRHDHVYLRWPESWLGVLLGRLERAVLLHGHGARYAAEIMPNRGWKTAICVREPVEHAVSIYQQHVKDMRVRNRPPPSLERWLEDKIARAEMGEDLNNQVRWLGQSHVASPMAPRGVSSPKFDLDALSARALDRLDNCSLVGTPATVGRVFERVARSASLRIRIDQQHDGPPANASAVPSARLAEALPAELREGLNRLTSRDQLLFARAQAHPGWVA